MPTVAACIDLVVHCSRTAAGRRQVAEILALGERVENGLIETSSVFTRVEGTLRPSETGLPKPAKFARAGIDTALLDAV